MGSFSTIVIGHETLTRECCARLLDRGHSLAAVVTRNAAVSDWAQSNHIPVEAPGSDLARRLAGRPCDWLLSIANLDILPDDLLALPARGAINFHDGPLPRHAGLNAPVWALIEGETRHGITWHMIESGVDTGDIVIQRMFDITPADTALTLNTKCFEAALNSFDDLMATLETGAPDRTRQDLSLRSVHLRADRPASAGLLDVTRPAAELDRLIRALDHGPYWNPLSTPKIAARDRVWHVGAAQLCDIHADHGTITDVTDKSLTLACGVGGLILSDLRDDAGNAADPRDIAAAGDVLRHPDAAILDTLSATMARLAPHDGFWRQRLADLAPAVLPALDAPGDFAQGERRLELPGDASADAVMALWAARICDTQPCDIAWCPADLAALTAPGNVTGWVPLRAAATGTVADTRATFAEARDKAAARLGFASDLPLRDPDLPAPRVPDIGLSEGGMIPGTALTVEITGTGARMLFDTSRVTAEHAGLLAERFEHLARTATPDDPAARISIVPDSERDRMLQTWNATDTDHDRSLTMHRAFEAQVARTPDAPALTFEAQTLSYAELNSRANRAAHVLRDMGVGPDVVVGLCTHRSVDLMVGALAILKAGGAYLPMDPGYPAQRLQHFLSDSGASVIVTQADLEAALPAHTAQVLSLDADPRIAQAPGDNLPDTSGPRNLAYLIYTSGSTGQPKGVMVEHRNVANFYIGMDDRVAHDAGGTWLAVTSLSFDISVLELFYATARGFRVVLTSDEDRGLISEGPMPMSDQGMEFSLYYWGNDDGVGPDKYKTLIEGAKFGDENGFVAVWTPERHFHAFGGPYPNPSVTGAAVAGMTKNIGVRAGSCVAPLHHPARIAEEWAVIDNLTNGRAGLAIASGWQPDDFVLRPENTPPDNKPAMIDAIHTLRKLWAGEAVDFPRKDGTMHSVVTQPRPVSKELPVWVTTAGNPETWKEAGRLGANVLTHLLGQSVDEVKQKIGIYHEALREAGFDPAQRTVTLMLHTFVAATRDEARAIAREPMKDYLRSAAGLIKQYAWAFPAFKKPEGVKNPFELDLGSLDEDELEGILDFAFERYFNDSGMFGTVEDCVARAEELKRIGVSEIACLIDYGIDADTVLAGLRPLAEVVARANVAPELAADDFSIAAQILRHDVTHLQCTPSMARMIAMNDEARFALSRVKHLMLGGEPLPAALVAEFRSITQAGIENMYGPTETTIWSTTETAGGSAESDAGTGRVVNIGRPIANTRVYVLDANRAPVPVGQPGELWIGGEGVTRGYWNQPDLTAERFADNPFHPGRMYATGDLVRQRADGRMDFLGRVDTQVKIRGHRIELGEIEAVLAAQTGITQAVVAAREDTPGDVRLVGYYTGTDREEARLKDALAAQLPAHMVPQRFVRLTRIPLTPNKKIDRKALPAPEPRKPRADPAPAAPQMAAAPGSGAALQARIATIWQSVLGVEGITGSDNFFDLGGHSLLAVQTHRAIRDQLGAKALSITDVFRFPTLAALADRVGELVGPDDGPPARPEPAGTEAGQDRAQARSDAMARRRAMRARRRA